ncbi:MAG: DUF2029 domain-containing protein [Candidatus Thermoplasmatota archaeon]|nr:DUF2029 domain-containing protein [Candidatus Thermoplasmatota archaeon]
METGRKGTGKVASNTHRPILPVFPLVALTVSYVILLVLTSVMVSDWSNFKIVLMAWFLSFLGLIYLMVRSPLIEKLKDLDPLWMMVLLFSVTLLLHLPFLLNEHSMSQDILRMERRGELLLDGRFPYRDFEVNKPPLYIWMIGLLSFPLGADQLIFRIAFSVASSIIPPLMLFIHRASGNSSPGLENVPFGIRAHGFSWMTAALAYSLCPIPLIETGLGGHFDPVVVLATVGAFLFLVKRKPALSGLLLGTGFALKLYPAFLAPVFFLSFERWRDRMKFAGFFFLVPVLASLPILITDPSLMSEYLKYQFVNWYTGFSIRYLLEFVTSAVHLPEGLAYYTLTAILLAGLAYLLLRGLVGKLKRIDTSFQFSLLLILSFMGASLSSAFFFRGAETAKDTASAIASLLFTTLMIGASVYVFLHWKPAGKPAFGGLSIPSIFTRSIDMRWVPLLSSCILLLVVLTSAQFHPWYIAWILPFSLASGNIYWSWSTLLLFSSLQYNYYPPWEIGGF